MIVLTALSWTPTSHINCGVILFAIGTGPVKGFAITLAIGILTSMFTAITMSRGIVQLIYGRKGRLAKLSI